LSGLLITGASGLVGGELLARLAPARPGARIYVLVRDPDRLPAQFHGPQFSILKGDIRHPLLGLADWQVSALRRSVTEIVHCAADTRFDATLADARETNVTGTGNLLRLAADCERLIKFLHVSTVYVAGRLGGAIPESVFTHTQRFCNAYQQSKYEAEALVASFAGSVPAVIARLSTIVGDSRGQVRQQNYVHQLLRIFPRSHLQQAPYESKALVDLISSDWAAGALSWLFLNRFQAGAVWHISDGPTAGFTVEEMLAETHRLFAHHPKAQRWLPIELPRLVPLTDYEDFVERTVSSGSRLAAELLRVVGYYLPHLGIAQTFENHLTRTLLAPSGTEPPPVRELYADVVRWCLDTDWGRA
jgi:nucleoside-diphosphate-sugar epimerase